MNYTLREIEDAIVDQLRAGRLDNLFPEIKIDGYYGEITPALVDQVAMGHSVCLVTFGGERYSDPTAGHEDFDVQATYTVIMAHKDLRSRERTVRGENVQNPGLYDMAYEVRRCLAGNNLNLDIDPLAPDRLEVFEISEKISIFLFDFVFSHDYDRSTEN